MKDNMSGYITIRFEASECVSDALSAFLDSYFEVSSLDYLDNGLQQYVGYVDTSFDEKDLIRAAERAHVNLPKYVVEQCQNKNWLKETAVLFKPFETADFCIYGIHEQIHPKTQKNKIQIDAATAFGSTHQTTLMCLQAMSDLSRLNFVPSCVLDVGTGSGILSVAAAKKWRRLKPNIISVDIDNESVRMALENAHRNHVAHLMKTAHSNGFRAGIVLNNAPYDLIFANIFARPLRLMAKDMAHYIKPAGYAVLSGFTKDQTAWVLKAYEKYGFKCIKIYEKDNWRAVMLQKKDCLTEIQSRLEENQAFVIQRNNMFLSEDVLETENKILELTGFTGSAGMLAVLKNKVFLLVDGRYTIQAKKQVLKGIEVVETDSFYLVLADLLHQNKIKTVRVNPWCISTSGADLLKQSNFEVLFDLSAPASSVSMPQKILTHKLRFTGVCSQDKINKVIKAVVNDFDAILLTSAEEVSFMANLRARDLPCSPVLRAFALLKKNGTLKVYGCHQLHALISDLKKCQHVIYQKNQTPWALSPYLQNAEDIGFDAVSKQKLQKNPVEIEGFINAHVRDGVAMVKFLYWLEKNYQFTSELDIVQKLHEFRARGKHYFSESFETIAAVDANAAIVHYQPNAQTNKRLLKNSLCLIDSGAQYFDGTTDITRTIAFGRISSKLKHDFTLVLKAHIALASCVFEKGMPAFMLDAVCRDVMTSEGKDFKHGTGHSVGHFSNVHEAPFALNKRNKMPVLENYVTSIEPGFYLEGKYGIRIENLVYVTKAKQKDKLCFETLTLCPIDLSLIETSILTDKEQMWLNAYHQKVFNTLQPFLNKSERVWLKEKCCEI